jgi:hypothetical protein
MPVNVFAKTGLIGLFLLTGLLLYLGRASWSWWSLRTGTVELAALPMLAALLIRGISDDVFLAFQTPVILGVIAAMCAMRKPNRTMPQPSAQGTLIQPSEVK